MLSVVQKNSGRIGFWGLWLCRHCCWDSRSCPNFGGGDLAFALQSSAKKVEKPVQSD